jgi:hypothetical protein
MKRVNQDNHHLRILIVQITMLTKHRREQKS